MSSITIVRGSMGNRIAPVRAARQRVPPPDAPDRDCRLIGRSLLPRSTDRTPPLQQQQQHWQHHCEEAQRPRSAEHCAARRPPAIVAASPVRPACREFGYPSGWLQEAANHAQVTASRICCCACQPARAEADDAAVDNGTRGTRLGLRTAMLEITTGAGRGGAADQRTGVDS